MTRKEAQAMRRHGEKMRREYAEAHTRDGWSSGHRAAFALRRMRSARDLAARRGIVAKQIDEACGFTIAVCVKEAIETEKAVVRDAALASASEARAAADRLWTMVGRLVRAMRVWGAQEDGVPEAGPGEIGSIGGAYDDARALLKEIPGPCTLDADCKREECDSCGLTPHEVAAIGHDESCVHRDDCPARHPKDADRQCMEMRGHTGNHRTPVTPRGGWSKNWNDAGDVLLNGGEDGRSGPVQTEPRKENE